uniref:(northern house mosquito) hypothetical protein n=1 Tax=Culex pipiens TaxID=7175 RepID=A0A8D8NWF7_CULPI
MFCLKIASIPEPQTGHAQVHNTKKRLNFKQFTFCMPSFLLLRYLVLYSVKYFMDTLLFFFLLLQSLYYFKVCFPKRNFFLRSSCQFKQSVSSRFRFCFGSTRDFLFCLKDHSTNE